MHPWLANLMISLLPPLLVGICTATVTVHLTLRRFYAERWWERKADAYSRITEALYIPIDYFDRMSECEINRTEISDERLAESQKKLEEAQYELKKAIHLGGFIISEDISKALVNLQKRPSLDPQEHAWFEVFDDEWAAYKNTLSEIMALAKKELRIK